LRAGAVMRRLRLAHHARSRRRPPAPGTPPLSAHSRELLRQACREPLPHPDWPSLRAAGHQAVDWLIADPAALPQTPLVGGAPPALLRSLLDEPAPEEPRSFDEVLQRFAARVAPYTCRCDHPRFFGFIPGAPSFVSVIGDLLAAGTNFFAGNWLEASGPAQVERIVLDWFRQALGMPEGTAGLLTSGG